MVIRSLREILEGRDKVVERVGAAMQVRCDSDARTADAHIDMPLCESGRKVWR